MRKRRVFQCRDYCVVGDQKRCLYLQRREKCASEDEGVKKFRVDHVDAFEDVKSFMT